MVEDKDQLRYAIRDNLCAKAIEEFKDTSSVPEWLQENRSLFDSISYQPPGLPRILDASIGGRIFENIQKFGRLYMAVDTECNGTTSNCS
jgi:hypothetical protein